MANDKAFFLSINNTEGNAFRPFFNKSAAARPIQPKLTLGQLGNEHEQEADRAADQDGQLLDDPQVFRPTIQSLPIAHSQRKPVFESEADPEVQPKCEDCGAAGGEKLRMAPAAELRSPAITSSSLESRLASRKGRGSPLPEDTRQSMERVFGADFGEVKVHTDSESVAMNLKLNAQAFTHGQDVYFSEGKYEPGTRSGQQLLAHELTHVVQQRGRQNSLVQRESAGSATNMSITADWTKGLSDEKLVWETGAVRQRLLETVPGELEREALRSNLTVLEEELNSRPRTIGELAASPLPTATIILAGSPTNNAVFTEHDRSPYNFSNAAVKSVPKIKAAFSGATITILFFTPGYHSRGEDVYKKAKKDLEATGVRVIEVDSADKVINYLNTGLVAPADSIPTRAVKVSRFFYFGHSTAGEFLLNWGWGDEGYASLSKDEIANIKTGAFDPIGESYLFSCHIAEGKDSFMSVWNSHLGQTTIGPEGNAAFNAKYESADLEKAINERLPDWFLGLPYMNKVKILGP